MKNIQDNIFFNNLVEHQVTKKQTINIYPAMFDLMMPRVKSEIFKELTDRQR